MFIGPSPHAIREMGNKATAKRIMQCEEVPCIPGYDGAEQDDAALAREADRIGYPLMVKAMAGGGGKGMRLVAAAAQLPEALRAARSEALKAFGNGALMLEKAILAPRHVEVQIFGDVAGNVVYLGDRDCSVQRRHQKVIEEAPAPGLPKDLRVRMGEAAVRAAKAVDYVGAGTVEFLVTDAGDFYFLEMNTRLQVEHPVTEMVTGLDLVEWQIRIARGERLPLTQEQVRLNGHAIEVRVYAEDPCAGFLPQTGRLHVWHPPEGSGIRVDSGLNAGATVSTSYDPMVAKVIASGPDRDVARRRLASALERFAIGGLRNNLHFLRQCLLHPVFAKADLDTGFLDREQVDVSACAAPEATSTAIAAALWQSRDVADVDPSLRHWHSRPWRSQKLVLASGETTATLRVSAMGAGLSEFSVEHADGSQTRVGLIRQSGTALRVRVDGVDEQVHAVWSDGGLDLVRGDCCFRFEEEQASSVGRVAAGTAVVTAPMPGSIAQLRVAPGQMVSAGEVLLILEAMKMEHEIQAPVSGCIEQVHAHAGQQVGMRKVLVHIVAGQME